MLKETVKQADPALFRQIDTRTVSIDESIVKEIRALIEAGDIRPGDRLPAERDLARAFSVSRPSLREAMRRLATMGLVEIRWGQGVFIRASDLDFLIEHMTPLVFGQGNVVDLYEIRRQLEVAAAGWAAERATAEEKAALRQLSDGAVAQRDLLSADPELARDIDRRYHNMIAALSHNAVLVRVMIGLLDLLADLRQRSFAIPGRAQRSLDEHERITAAIERGDAPASREAMLRHLEQAEAAIRSTL